jgi:hypothetical protein
METCSRLVGPGAVLETRILENGATLLRAEAGDIWNSSHSE